jgi:hypothetical protein
VKARNSAGAFSEAGSSDGIEVVAEAATIAAAKCLSNGSPVAMVNKIVTASAEDSYYIEEADRFSGILVKGALPEGVGEGALVTIGGMMGLSNGERAILDPATVMESAADPARIPRPLFMTNLALAGDAFNADTLGATDRFGLNNIGLLVTVCGWYGHGDDRQFYIDDGSEGGPIKVVSYGIDLSGYTSADYMMVTGIVSVEYAGTAARPIMRVMSGGRIVKAN